MSLILDGTLGLSDVDGSASTPAIRGTDSNTGVFFATDIVGLATGGTERMRIDSSGNVCIGTTTGVQPLTIGGTGNIYASSGATWYTGGDLYVRAGTGGFLSFGANNSNDLMRLTSAGNFGIGTSSPLGRLHVSNSGLTTLYISDTGEATNQKNWAFQYGTGIGAGTFRLRALNDANSDGQNAYIITRTGNAVDTHQWLTANTERMRIDSSGNVGIGTSSPGGKLHLYGDFNAIYGLRLQSTRGTGRSYGFATVGANADSLALFDITGSEASLMNFSNTGAVALKGGVTNATGTGITFPATQSASSDANTLDDYEEGTFTPTATGSGVTGTTTYTVQQGFYTKIGRQVTVNINLYYTAMTGTGNLLIGGLPFTSANTANNFSVGTCMTVGLDWASGSQLSTFLIQNSTSANIYCSGDNIGGNYQGCVNEQAEIYITLTYMTS